MAGAICSNGGLRMPCQSCKTYSMLLLLLLPPPPHMVMQGYCPVAITLSIQPGITTHHHRHTTAAVIAAKHFLQTTLANCYNSYDFAIFHLLTSFTRSTPSVWGTTFIDSMLTANMAILLLCVLLHLALCLPIERNNQILILIFSFSNSILLEKRPPFIEVFS